MAFDLSISSMDCDPTFMVNDSIMRPALMEKSEEEVLYPFSMKIFITHFKTSPLVHILCWFRKNIFPNGVPC